MADLQHIRVVYLILGPGEGLMQHAGHFIRQLLVAASQHVDEDDGRGCQQAE